MRRILFVDDDVQALEALRDALRARRREWEMTFRVGSEAALGALDSSDFEVVVSDLGMPGVDGAELLDRVRERRPGAVRILMSGSVDLDVIARTTSVAHRLLAKPCDIAELTRVVERSCELHELTRNEGLRRAATGVTSLPGAPGTYVKLAALLDDPAADMREAAAVVEQDPAIAARVLQLANSAFFGGSPSITSLDRAVTRIGLRALATLALSAGAFAAFTPRVGELFSLDALQRHAGLVARIAPGLLPAGQMRDDALAGGLLHDIGALVLATQEPDYFADVLGIASRERRSLVDVEYEQRGVSHAEVGAHLLELWGVPGTVVEAVAYHHRPQDAPEPTLDALAAVAIAEQLAHDHQSDVCAARPAGVDADYLEQLGVTDRFPEWHERAAREAGAAA